jgi:hypothetical protein
LADDYDERTYAGPVPPSPQYGGRVTTRFSPGPVAGDQDAAR